MSGTLPFPSSTTNSIPSESMPTSLDGSEEAFDLVSMLLAEQQTLTAVEEFATEHADASVNNSATTPAQARYYTKLMPASPPGPGQQLAFDVDLDSCSGCKACVVACHTMNGLEEDESWRRVGTLIIGEAEPEDAVPTPAAIGVQHVTTACHHCEDPGCLNGCPVKAYDKDPVTGVVRHLDDQCIGCKYCTMMCPYEVPQYSDRLGIVRKCDMCHQRLSAGEAPACVQSCPNEAISIRIVDTDRSDAPRTARLVPGAPLSSITQPTTAFTTSREAVIDAAVPQDNRIDRPAEDHWPLAALLVATQIGVGMLIVERLVASVVWLSGSPLAVESTKWIATVAWVVSMIGMNLAPLHLGQPLRSWRVFLGLRTSWLSREAVLLGKFVGLLSIAVGLFWLPTIAPHVPAMITDRLPGWLSVPDWTAKAALGTSILVGIAGLYSSAMIYIATKRVLWRHERTLARFFGTSAVAGLACCGAAFCFLQTSVVYATVIGVVALAAIATKLTWEQRTHLGKSGRDADDYDRRSRRLVHLHLGGLRTTRLVTGWLGVVALAAAIGLTIADAGFAGGVAYLTAAMLISGGEFSERLLYFSSVVHDRMPGTMQ